MAASKAPRLRVRYVLSVLATAAILLVGGLAVLPGPGLPQATWKFGPEKESVDSFAKVPMYDSAVLDLDLPFPAWVYVLSFDHQQGTVGYFPTEYLATDHKDKETGKTGFLPAGRHVLPGTLDEKEMAWYVPNVDEAVSFVVVVCKRKLEDLDKVMTLVRQMGNTAFPDRSMGLYMPRAGSKALIGERKVPHKILDAAMHHLQAAMRGPMVAWEADPEVYFKVLHVLPSSKRPGTKNPTDPFRQKLEKMVEERKQQGK